MKSTFNPGHPGQPAVAAIPAVAPTLTVELTMDEAAQLRALVGKTYGDELYELFRVLKSVEDHAPRYTVTSSASSHYSNPALRINKA